MAKEKRGEPFYSPRFHGGSLNRRSPFSGTGHASLSFIAPIPAHLLQRFEKIDEFPIRKRAEVPGFIGSDKAPAIRDKAVHRIADTKVGMSATINAIVLGPASHIKDHWTGRSNNMYNMSLYIGVESFYGKPQDS